MALLRNLEAGSAWRVRFRGDRSSRRPASLWVGLAPSPTGGQAARSWSRASLPGVKAALEVAGTAPEPAAFLSLEVQIASPPGVGGTLRFEVWRADVDPERADPTWQHDVEVSAKGQSLRYSMTIVT